MELTALLTDPVAAGIVVGALVLILLGAAWHKFAEPNAFLAALAGYRIVPDAALGLFSKLVPGTEAVLAGALLIPLTRQWALLGTAVLLLSYAAAIAVNLLRGRSYIDCGCGGTAHPLSWGLVIRNAVVAAAAIAVSGPNSGRGFDWLDGIALVLGVLAFYVTYLMADELMRQASRMTRTQPHQDTELAP